MGDNQFNRGFEPTTENRIGKIGKRKLQSEEEEKSLSLAVSLTHTAAPLSMYVHAKLHLNT